MGLEASPWLPRVSWRQFSFLFLLNRTAGCLPQQDLVYIHTFHVTPASSLARGNGLWVVALLHAT